MLCQVARPRLAQQPVARGTLTCDQWLGPRVADQQQHAWRLVADLGLLDLQLQRLDLLVITRGKLRGLLLGAEQPAQVLEVGIDSREVGLAGEQFDAHAGATDLRQHRWRAHFFGASQQVRAQAENALGRQLALIADARQRFERFGVLAGGVDAYQAWLAAQFTDPLAQRPAGTDPALWQFTREDVGASYEGCAQGEHGGGTAHHRIPSEAGCQPCGG